MKILQISTYYPPHFGGIEQLAYDFTRILTKQGNEVKVICFNGDRQTVKDVYQGIEIIRVGYKLKFASQAISLVYLFELKKVLNEFKPDVIHIHLPNPLIATYLLMLRPKCHVTLHWHSDIVKQKKMKLLYGPFEKALIKRGERIVTTTKVYAENSESIKNYLNKVYVIPSPINETILGAISESEAKQINQIKEKYKNKKIVFFIGLHREYKGLRYLVDSAQYLTDEYIVVIAGKGPLTEELKQKTKELNLQNIVFIGRISDDEKKIYLYASDIYAFPSITKNEAYGLALVEALFCGLPAVTFTIKGSGVNYVNQDGITGIEVHDFDAKKYAQALMNVSKEKYGFAAHKWAAENFTESAIWGKVAEFFNF